jgi:hypothetical protein
MRSPNSISSIVIKIVQSAFCDYRKMACLRLEESSSNHPKQNHLRRFSRPDLIANQMLKLREALARFSAELAGARNSPKGGIMAPAWHSCC